MPPLRLTPLALSLAMLPSVAWSAHNLPLLAVNPALLGLPATAVNESQVAASSTGTAAPVGAEGVAEPAADESLAPVFVSGAVTEQTTVLVADNMRGTKNQQSEAVGNAELHRGTQSIFADQLTYFEPEDRVLAEGNVRVLDKDAEARGPYLEMQLETHEGYMQKPVYAVHNPEGHGDGDEMLFEGEKKYRIKRARYTTCEPGREDWYLNVRELELDRNVQVGVAHHAYLDFMGVPLMYTPWMDFPLNNQRKSGFLTPTVVASGRNGAGFSLPYYWNIAPNRDATLTTRFMSERGVQLGGEFRYLDPRFNGVFNAELLPDDQKTGQTRSAVSLVHNHNQLLLPNMSGWVSYRSVSDNDYFRDLSTRMTQTSQGNLLQEAGLSYSGGWWQLTGRVQKYQTLQDPLAPILPPYQRLPQINLNVLKQNVRGLDLGLQGEWVSFEHPSLLSGRRTVAYPYVSLPWVAPYGFITPKVGVHYTSYDLPDNAGQQVSSRELPIVSLDGGLIFERSMTWGDNAFTQTLEPRMYYLYVPYVDQSALPVFDTALAGFNYAQLFAENIFVGSDRIANANQVTAAVTSRLLDTGSGVEVLRAALGQRYYFEEQKVTLPGGQARTGNRSDLLATLSGRIGPDLTADAGWQYSPDSKSSQKYNVNVRYMPARGKVLNWGYRFDRGTIDQMDVSAQWPLFRDWYGVARWNYSKRDHKVLETIAGLEYNGGCWVFRMVGTRFPTATNSTQSALFFELEFNGLSSLGSSPVNLLKQRIGGYAKTNTFTSDTEESYAP